MADASVSPAPGVLLLAHPMLTDPNFRRAVVLLCEHSAEGSFGLILNKPLALELGEVVEGVASDVQVSLGGPVQPNTLHYLHRHQDVLTDATPVTEHVAWGGDFDLVKALVLSEEASPQTLRFFLGYSGWASRQLEEEIEEGGWILTELRDVDLSFPENPEQLWRTVLRRMGGEYAYLANFPDDPRMN